MQKQTKRLLLPFIAYGVLFILPAILVWFWWQASGTLVVSQNNAWQLLAFGRLSGLLLAFGVLLQIVLIGRTGFIEKIFGFDNLARLHHWTGFSLAIFIIAHPLLLIYSYAHLNGRTLSEQLFNFIFSTDDLFGAFVATFLFLGVILISISLVRLKLRYETWYLPHLLTYVAIALAFGHQIKLGGDFAGNLMFVIYWYVLYAFAFGNLLWFRFLRPLYAYQKYRFRVERVVPENDDSFSIYIAGKNLAHWKANSGQFIIVRFLTKKLWWQAHPFSLSCAPSGQNLRITVKALGDFTKQLANISAGTPVIIDGPHGIFTEQMAVSNKLLFIAGGIGITPIRSLIEEAAKKSYDISLLYSVRRPQDFIFKNELEKIMNTAQGRAAYFASQSDMNWDQERGRINQEKITRLVPDVLNRDIYICGPKDMIKNMRVILHQLGVPKKQLHYERFSL